MCVVVCITVAVWECCRGACEAVARVMTAVKREQLSSSLQQLTILSCSLQELTILPLLTSERYQFCLAHFKVQNWPVGDYSYKGNVSYLIKVWTSDQLWCLIWISQQLAILLWTVGPLSLQIDWITCFDNIVNIGIKVLDQTKFKWTFFLFRYF